MIRFLFLACAALVFLGSSVMAQPQPSQALKPGEELRGDFAQERHLAGLVAPLQSVGKFTLEAGTGLIWRGEKPFATIIVITKAGILQTVDGSETQHLAAARLPFLTRFYDMLSGALSGDWSVLEHDFSVARQGAGDGWKVVLTPLRADDPMATQIQSITVTGGKFVDTVEIHRPSGDWERLAFTDQSRSTAPLSPEDAALFDKASAKASN